MAITIKELRIYEKCSGDYYLHSKIDGSETGLLNKELFATISELLRKVHVVKSCLASQEFKEEFHRELDTITDGKKTIAYLFRMIKA